MAVRIKIEKTVHGYCFNNMNLWDTPLVAIIRESTNKPGIYMWDVLGEGKSGFDTLDRAMGWVKLHLTRIAVERLGTDIEFIKDKSVTE